MSDTKYEITILNWDKYQREMRGGEKRRRRRDWVAISVDLYSDPDYIEMTSMYRDAWIGMLLHAGKVGPTFKLRPSDARLLFKLHHSPDFEVFKKQGFIDLEAATDKTVQDRQDIPPAEGAEAPSIRERIWKLGPEVLGNSATDRSYIGKLVKEYGEGSVLAALEATRDHGGGDPKSYVTGVLKSVTGRFKYRKPEEVSEEQRKRDAEKAVREMAALAAKT